MRKFYLILALLLIIPASFCFDCESVNPKKMGSSLTRYSVSGLIELNFDDFSFENVEFNFRGVPHVNVLRHESNMALDIDEYGNQILVFEASNPSENLLWYYEASLSSVAKNEKIENNPPFPYAEEFPDEIKDYLEFTRTANEDDDIKLMASELVTGVSDYLTAIGKISQFVAYGLSYDLSYAGALSDASTVFMEKQGVCVEFSTLAISMLRSVGIPARYVSGYSFTDAGSKECFNFESHSWAEAYVPGHGWVSIDLTYKEFFWINSGHVPLYKSPDLIDISSLLVERRGASSADFVKSNVHSFEIELLQSDESGSDLSLSVSAPQIVAQDSYILINVSINNPTNYWIADTLVSAPIWTVDLINTNHAIPIIIPPMQSLTEYFIFKVPDLGCENFSCYSDANFIFYFGGGEQDFKTVRIGSDFQQKDSLADLLLIAGEDESIIVHDLSVRNIKFNREKFLAQNPVLSFLIKNAGNSIADVDLTIEYAGINITDRIENLLINEERLIEKTLALPSVNGVVPVNLTFESQNQLIVHNSSFIVVKEPDYDISLIKSGELSYSLIIGTDSPVIGTLRVSVNGRQAVFLELSKENSIIIEKEYLKDGRNIIEFIIDYSEDNEYYFKVINDYIDYSMGIFEKIRLLIDSIIGFFRIIFSL